MRRECFKLRPISTASPNGATCTAGGPECRRGRVYHQKEPATLVRFVGHAPLEATVFEMERLRCNACGEGLHRRRTGDGGSGEVRRDGRSHDRPTEVRYRSAI